MDCQSTNRQCNLERCAPPREHGFWGNLCLSKKRPQICLLCKTASSESSSESSPPIQTVSTIVLPSTIRPPNHPRSHHVDSITSPRSSARLIIVHRIVLGIIPSILLRPPDRPPLWTSSSEPSPHIHNVPTAVRTARHRPPSYPPNHPLMITTPTQSSATHRHISDASSSKPRKLK